MKSALIVLALSIGIAASSGCGSTTPQKTDGSVTPPTDGSGVTVLNGCSSYVDKTASGASITFPMAGAPMQYQPACVHIKAGQTVTWTGSFSSHPLIPEGGGTPNPTPDTSTGTTTTMTFPNAGTYGYGCGIHASMMGAIQVTP